MIQNPTIPAYQYNPYSRQLTREEYGFELMVKNRQHAIEAAKASSRFGLIQGTLGRQGNIKIFEVQSLAASQPGNYVLGLGKAFMREGEEIRTHPHFRNIRQEAANVCGS